MGRCSTSPGTRTRPPSSSAMVTPAKPLTWRRLYAGRHDRDQTAVPGPSTPSSAVALGTTVDGIDLDTGKAEVTLRAGGNGICTYVNTRTIYNPQMELSKTPSPPRCC